MTRVIHTGDTHIGYQQYHSPERRRDFLAAFEQVIADAIDGEVDAVVHAGDLFHDRRPDLPDLLGTLAALRRLDAAGVPFLAVVGNHEATHGGQWLDLFEQLGLATRLDASPHVVGDVAFYGLDYVPRSRRDDLDLTFEATDAAHAVLVTHGLFTPFASEEWAGVWNTDELLDRANRSFDALLLGDDHTPETIRIGEAETVVTYSGSTERTSASEREGRGYNLVTFTDGVDVRRRALETRPFVFVDVSLAEDEGVERVRERVRQHDLDDAVVIVEITGSGEPVAPATVEEAATEAGALIARVTDRRTIQTETDEPVVQFADPDAAVRERLVDLGLSSAAIEVDQTVRGDDVVDSNVRDAVRTRVEELISADVEAFEPATDETVGSPDAETAIDDAETDDRPPSDDGRETVPPDDATVANGATDSAAADARADDAEDGDTADEDDGDGPSNDDDPIGDDADSTGDDADSIGDDADSTGDDADSIEDDGDPIRSPTEAEPGEAPPRSSETGSTDGQVSMEDFL